MKSKMLLEKSVTKSAADLHDPVRLVAVGSGSC